MALSGFNSSCPGRVRVKYCGITRAKDAAHAVELGVDAIGLVFYEPSPRAVDIVNAVEICTEIPAFVTRVGLFVNPQPGWVSEVMGKVSLDCLQFHGEESPAACEQFGLPYIKALRMKPAIDLHELASEFAAARALLLDSYTQGIKGGTGNVFDWSRVPNDLSRRVILAGGLTPENVAEAIAVSRPYAVDVSGGIETDKGIKDHNKMNEFMRGVKSACY